MTLSVRPALVTVWAVVVADFFLIIFYPMQITSRAFGVFSRAHPFEEHKKRTCPIRSTATPSARRMRDAALGVLKFY
jgi:hypothetical protein